MERIEASVVLQGMEVRMMEAINERMVDIQRDTEHAVKKAIEEYDFDYEIGKIVNEWLEDKIRDMSINVLGNEMFDVSPELSRIVMNTINKSLSDRIEKLHESDDQ